jgi:hypothetical protein
MYVHTSYQYNFAVYSKTGLVPVLHVHTSVIMSSIIQSSAIQCIRNQLCVMQRIALIVLGEVVLNSSTLHAIQLVLL